MIESGNCFQLASHVILLCCSLKILDGRMLSITTKDLLGFPLPKCIQNPINQRFVARRISLVRLVYVVHCNDCQITLVTEISQSGSSTCFQAGLLHSLTGDIETYWHAKKGTVGQPKIFDHSTQHLANQPGIPADSIPPVVVILIHES